MNFRQNNNKNNQGLIPNYKLKYRALILTPSKIEYDLDASICIIITTYKIFFSLNMQNYVILLKISIQLTY